MFTSSTGWKFDEKILQGPVPGISVSADVLTTELEDMGWQTGRCVHGKRRCSSSLRWGLLNLKWHMAFCEWKTEEASTLVDVSQSEEDRCSMREEANKLREGVKETRRQKMRNRGMEFRFLVFEEDGRT